MISNCKNKKIKYFNQKYKTHKIMKQLLNYKNKIKNTNKKLLVQNNNYKKTQLEVL